MGACTLMTTDLAHQDMQSLSLGWRQFPVGVRAWSHEREDYGGQDNNEWFTH